MPSYISTADLSKASGLELSQIEGLITRRVFLVQPTGRGRPRKWTAAELDCAKTFSALRKRRRLALSIIVPLLVRLRAARTARERRRLLEQAVLLRIAAYPHWEIRIEAGPEDAYAIRAGIERGFVLKRERVADILAEKEAA